MRSLVASNLNGEYLDYSGFEKYEWKVDLLTLFHDQFVSILRGG